MTAADMAQIFASLAAAIGLLLTAAQLKADIRQRGGRGAEYLGHFLKSFWRDDEKLEAYYEIEYSTFAYSPEFHRSDFEVKVDKMLECFGIIAKLHQAGLVPIKNLSVIRYEYLVVYQNQGIQKYFQTLDDWLIKRKIDARPFDEFRIVGSKLQSKYYRR